mgnify:CR=1 FL=1
MNNKKWSGWLFLDKPIGVTSNFALQKIKRIFNNSKAGFVGTLDPLASGFLPVALGKATKIIPLIEKCDKRYLFTVKWGIKTETGDSEGKVIKESDKYPDKFEIVQVLKKYNGNIEQFPHKYSSVKINGQRAYKLARKNMKFQLKKRKIKVNNFTLTNNISERLTSFFIDCSAGTYVRSLAESLAESLGTIGTVVELRRIGFNNFNKKLISLDYLLSLVHSDELKKLVHPIDAVMNDFLKIQLDDNQAKRVLRGSFVQMNKNLVEMKKNGVVFAKHENKFIALGLIKDCNFHPKKLLIT